MTKHEALVEFAMSAWAFIPTWGFVRYTPDAAPFEEEISRIAFQVLHVDARGGLRRFALGAPD